MADTHETIADIIAEMKREAAQIFPALPIAVLKLATRIEAAHRRESGNAAKLREALVKCQEITLQWQADEKLGVAGSIEKPEARSASEALIDIEFVANAALSAPPRNCDVGSAEEQTRRMEAEYCHRQKECYESPSGKSCPIYKHSIDCRLIWAQMPYEEGGAK